MGINNAGTNSIYAGVHTQSANSICHGIDVFGTGGPSPSGTYVAEDGTSIYVTEDGLNNYVTET